MYFNHVKRQMHTRVTFVGLGNMGYSMAANFRKGGYRVAGFDTNKSVWDLISCCELSPQLPS